jgi:hypothetical protein
MAIRVGVFHLRSVNTSLTFDVQSEDLCMETPLAQVFNTMTGQASSLTPNSAFVLASDQGLHSCATTSTTFRDVIGCVFSFLVLHLCMLLTN